MAKAKLDPRERRKRMELRDLARQYAVAVEMQEQGKKEQLSRLMELLEPGATERVLEQVNLGEPPDALWPLPAGR